MAVSDEKGGLSEWEKELLAGHRWGRLRLWLPDHPELWNEAGVSREHARLKELWAKAQPLSQECEDILRSIIALEICNWNLEDSILGLCKAIGMKHPPGMRIGHGYSITDERWLRVWAYYLALKKWLPSLGRFTGYDALLKVCDPDGETQRRVFDMLGEGNELKLLYVGRLCLNFEYWLGGFYPEGSAQFIAYSAAVEELEREIARLDPDPEMLEWIRLDGRRGWIEVCHHKAFRRFDIQISSIGAGEWRGAIPLRGTDGLERAETLERYLQPIEGWIGGTRTDQKLPDEELYRSIQELLGDRDDEKIFLASLLVSLLRPQQITAKKRAEKRIVLDM